MVDVRLWSGLRRFTDGETTVAVEAATVGGMLAALVVHYPLLDAVVQAGVTVSVNGEMATRMQTPIPEGAEVVLLQRIKGG